MLVPPREFQRLYLKVWRRLIRSLLQLKNRKPRAPAPVDQIWARVGMQLTFRAEVMPGREALERTFTVARIMDNGRVELKGLGGQHTRTEFEAMR